jgi:rfaE bifunctional protein kinase chain/domain
MFSKPLLICSRRSALVTDDPSPDVLQKTLHRWKGKRVIILGDMILDEYVYGWTERVSREAPVLIVRYDESGYSPGGAANAAQNVAAFGGRAVPIGLVGDDDAAAQLKALFRRRGIPTGGLVAVGGRFTTSKTRVMAGDYHAQRQQIVRIDKEQRSPLSAKDENGILARLAGELERADAVILSDYNQDLITAAIRRKSIDLCRDAGVPVVADSRFMLHEFRGVTTATPNEIEAAGAAGMSLGDDRALGRIARKLLRVLEASSIIVTRGKFGMCLFEPGKRIRSVGVIGSPEATDVTGAGDTVAAAVALTLAAGAGMHVAMLLANLAASIVVMKRGTAVAEVAEMLGVMEQA